jgi:hypothetical protein
MWKYILIIIGFLIAGAMDYQDYLLKTGQQKNNQVEK